jgi:putative ABC transport system permease protein
VSREVQSRSQVTARGTNTNTQIYGVGIEYQTVRNLTLSEGDFISESDVSSGARVAVLGSVARGDLFPEGGDILGESIRIKGVAYVIVGTVASKGGTGFSNPDEYIYVPYTTAQRLLTGDAYLNTISVSVATAAAIPDTLTQIDVTISDLHKIKEDGVKDFNILNQADILATASSITGILTALLSAIASISLIVGGIGIMNMMLTTVTERTREIGLRKAIGARPKDISRQFLAEAVVLTVLGGLIGVILGMMISYGITLSGVLTTSVTTWSVLLSVGVASLIGLIFGYYPARRAANLNPIDALRYE